MRKIIGVIILITCVIITILALKNYSDRELIRYDYEYIGNNTWQVVTVE